MNPEPPPIADPHSTAPAPSLPPLPRTFKTALGALLCGLGGILLSLYGVVNLIRLINLARPSLGYFQFSIHPGHFLFPLAFFILAYLCFRRSLRFWKHGR